MHLRVRHITYFQEGSINGIDAIVRNINQSLNRLSDVSSEIVSVGQVSLREIFSGAFAKLSCDCDLVVFHAVYVWKYWLLWPFLKRNGVPYIIIPHSSLLRASHKKGWFRKALCNEFFIKHFVRSALAVQFNNVPEEQGSVKKWNARYYCVHNGIERPSSGYWSSKETALASILDKQTAVFKVLFLGRFDIRHKGLDILVEQIAAAHEQLIHSGVEFHAYGPNHGNDLQILSGLIAQRGVGDIINLHGPVKRTELGQLFLTHDALIMLSRYEGEPMSALEAMSHGLPAILSTGTNIAEEFGAAGLAVVAGGNLYEDVQKIKTLVNSPGIFNVCRAKFADRDWGVIAAIMLREWLALLNK